MHLRALFVFFDKKPEEERIIGAYQIDLANHKQGDFMLYYVAWVILWPIRLFVKCEGRQNVPRDGLMIVVSNHNWSLDPYKIGPFLPFKTVIRWLAKKELYSAGALYEEYLSKTGTKFLAWTLAFSVSFVVRHSATIKVDRDQPKSRVNRLAVKEALDLLRKNQTIGVFGEGGTNRRGEVHPIFVNLARKSGARIIPVKLCKREVVFGKAISLTGDTRDSETVAREVMNKIYDL